MPDQAPSSASSAPVVPTKDLIFELGLFKTHYLLADYRRGKIEDEIWVSIGGDYIRLPNNYGKTLLDNDGLYAGIDPSEEFRHPRLYDPATEWRGYVPDAIAWYLDHPDDDILWPFQYYEGNDSLLETTDGTHKVPRALVNEISRDLKQAREIVCRLEERGGLPLTMVDSGYRSKWLWQCEDETACRYGLYKARSCLLHLLGAISWGLEHVDEWTKGLLVRTRGESLRRWLVLDAPKIGFVLDPRDPNLDDYPLLDARRAGCALYYPWSYRWRAEQSDEDLDALAGVDSRNFAMIIEKNWASPSPLLAAVREGPPLFPGTLLATRIASEEPEEAPKEPLDREDYEKRELRLRTLQEKAEKALGQEFTHTRPTYVIWSFKDEGNLPKDAIVLLNPVNELRLRLWDLWMRSANPAQIVLEAVARGMAVRLVYRLDSKTAEKAIKEHEPYTPPIPPRTLQGTHSMYWESWDEYLTLAKWILSLPDAVAYLTMGGIVTRIAVWLGPPDLVSRFTKGPSTYASLHPIDSESSQNYLTDVPDPERVKALCGIVEDPVDGTIRSWFPTQENIEYCGFWRGEWTEAQELWFLTRICNIQDRSEHTKPLTAHQWSAQLKRRRVRWLDKHNPDADEVEKLVTELALENGGPWNGATLEEIEARFGYD
ncbi:hypothetical protein BC629DRAFT_1443684 [Irpex lacteus]|nr:hypothetical protein BC629DRAFT_1443684 [Irpex lacteus]